MKKLLLSMLLIASFTAVQADDVMRKEKDGTYVVNTTTLARDVDGYMGPTPVEVYIKKNKVVKVVMLKNQETPKYNARVKKQMVPLYEGKKISKKSTVEVSTKARKFPRNRLLRWMVSLVLRSLPMLSRKM